MTLCKLPSVLVSVFFLAFMVACGRGTAPSQNSVNGGTSATPVFGGSSGSQFAARRGFSIVPGVQAAGPVTMTGTYSGFCAGIGLGGENAIYGLGRWGSSECEQVGVGVMVDGHLIGSETPFIEGAPILGDGTLSDLVVYAHGGTNPNSYQARIYVNEKLTSLGCTVGTAPRCEDTTHIIPVHDGDTVIATVSGAPIVLGGDIRIIFAKH